MLFIVDTLFCDRSVPHDRALERITNACFQISSNAVLQSTAIVDQVGCVPSKKQHPSSIPSSTVFSEIVELSKWNCTKGNTINLLQSIGQSRFYIRYSFKNHYVLDQEQCYLKYSINLLPQLTRSSIFQVVNLPSNLNYETLTCYVQKLCLPIIVLLSLTFNNTTYKYVVGICPYKLHTGDPT